MKLAIPNDTRTLKFILLGFHIALLLIVPYVHYYHLISPLATTTREILMIHGMLLLKVAVPMIVLCLYPFAVGLFNDKRNIISIWQNMKSKKHWIICGVLALILLQWIYIYTGLEKPEKVPNLLDMSLNALINFMSWYIPAALLAMLLSVAQIIRQHHEEVRKKKTELQDTHEE